MAYCPGCSHSRPLSSEHIWGKWTIKQFGAKLPKAAPARHTVRYSDPSDPGKQGVAAPGVFSGSYSTLHMKRRLVCERCNNGWMSQIENNAAAIFRRAQYFEDISDQNQDLAAWCALKASTYTYSIVTDSVKSRGSAEGDVLLLHQYMHEHFFKPLSQGKIPEEFAVAACLVLPGARWGYSRLEFATQPSAATDFNFHGELGQFCFMVTNRPRARDLLTAAIQRSHRYLRIIAPLQGATRPPHRLAGYHMSLEIMQLMASISNDPAQFHLAHVPHKRPHPKM